MLKYSFTLEEKAAAYNRRPNSVLPTCHQRHGLPPNWNRHMIQHTGCIPTAPLAPPAALFLVSRRPRFTKKRPKLPEHLYYRYHFGSFLHNKQPNCSSSSYDHYREMHHNESLNNPKCDNILRPWSYPTLSAFSCAACRMPHLNMIPGQWRWKGHLTFFSASYRICRVRELHGV